MSKSWHEEQAEIGLASEKLNLDNEASRLENEQVWKDINETMAEITFKVAEIHRMVVVLEEQRELDSK